MKPSIGPILAGLADPSPWTTDGLTWPLLKALIGKKSARSGANSSCYKYPVDGGKTI